MYVVFLHSGYMCTECDLHFKTAVLLEKHREAKHTTDTQPQGQTTDLLINLKNFPFDLNYRGSHCQLY